MSTKIKSRMSIVGAYNITLTRFYGGKVRGRCVAIHDSKTRTNIELDELQARALADVLNKFANREEEADELG
jgi:hypothetical protein